MTFSGQLIITLHAATAVTIAMLASGFYSWNLNGSTVLAMFLTVLGCGYVIVMLNEDRPNSLTNR